MIAMRTDPNIRIKNEGVVRQNWEPIKVIYVGHMAEVLQGGGGKLSLNAADTGDIRKPPGQG
jgi:hypothetical protein